MNRKLTLLWEMEVSEDLLHALLIHWQLLRFQHGVMELDTIMVYLNEILFVTESKVNVHPDPILLAHSLINV
jgi:hypothetical protein